MYAPLCVNFDTIIKAVPFNLTIVEMKWRNEINA
jgi:hypothetical protein